MPDRYGDADDDYRPTDPGLRAELHALAATVSCRHCHAIAGQPCTNPSLDGHPATRIPHPCRITDAEEIPF